MLFSVLIPLYNAEKYIGECIDSVLAQTCDDYEIVIIDDGSTDLSAEIVDHYQKNHPETIRVLHKENIGVLLTRRRLLQEAQGEYVIWVDSDDVIKPELLSDLRDEINSNKPDVIVYNYEFLDNPEKVICSLDAPHQTVFKGEEKKQIYLKMLLGRDMNELCTKCIKREFVDVDADYSQYRHVRMGDDLFCLLPIFDAVDKVEYINKSYYKYRMVASSITHTETYLRYYSYRTIFEREIYYATKWKFTSDEVYKLQNKFAYVAIDSIVSCANSPKKSFSDFLDFIADVKKSEEINPIFSNTHRKFKSKVYQYFYRLFMSNRYKRLYYNIKVISLLSKIKH